MRVLVLGASGGVGKHLTLQAVQRGHEVVALVRPTADFDPPSSVAVLRGEVLAGAMDAAGQDGVARSPLIEAMRGVDAVVSALGMKRRHPRNPWSRLTSPPRFNSDAARRIVVAMRAHAVPRVVAVSAAGVGDSASGLNAIMRFLVKTSSIGVAYRDLAEMERVYAESGLDWLAPRPTRLTGEAETGRAGVVTRFGSWARIGRADLASWMLDALDEPTWPRPDWGGRTPQISARR